MNFLVVGLGSAGQRHLRVLNKFYGSNANIYVYRGDRKRGLISDDLSDENFSINPVEYYDANEISTIAELIEKTWDLVIIATPPDSHCFYVEKLIKNSKRMLVEKPLSVNTTEALRIINLAEINNVSVCVGYQMAFHPFKDFIKDNINNVGKIESCNTVFNEDLSLMNPFRSMENHYLSKPTGGGAFLSLSHDLDFLLTSFDQTFADDIFFTNIKFSNNNSLVKCTLICTIQLEASNVNLISKFSILPGLTRKTGQIRGSRACIKWDFVSGIIELKKHDGKTENTLGCLVDKDELFRNQIKNILSLENYSKYCQINLNRAKFIVEANAKIRNE